MLFDKGHSNCAPIKSQFAIIAVLFFACALSCSPSSSPKTTRIKSTAKTTAPAEASLVASARIEGAKSGDSYVIRGTVATFPANAPRKFELVVRDSTGEVARKSIASKGSPTEILLPRYGAYAAEIVEEERVYETEVFLYAMTYCLDGTRTVRIDTGGSSFEEEEEEAEEEEEDLGYRVDEQLLHADDRVWLVLRSISGGDGWPGFEIQWFRDGKLVPTESQDLGPSSPLRLDENEEEAAVDCPVGIIERRIDIPKDVMLLPGHWELKIYSRDGPHYQLSFELVEDQYLWAVDVTLKELSVVPKQITALLNEEDSVLPEVWSQQAYTPMESRRIVRAALRMPGFYARLQELSESEAEPPAAFINDIAKYGAPWTKQERVWNVASKFVVARAVTDEPRHDICVDSKCNAYPAVSPNGRFIATNERVENETQDPDADECNKSYDYPLVVNGKPKPEKDIELFGYRKMNCTNKLPELLAGFHIEQEPSDEGGYDYIIAGPDGKTVAEVTSDEGVWDEVCVARDVRAVAIRTSYPGSHCYGKPAADFQFMRY